MENKNPDPNKYAKTLTGWELKPKQCALCKKIFIPESENQGVCDCLLPDEIYERKVILIRQKLYYSHRNKNIKKIEEYSNLFRLLTGKEYKHKYKETENVGTDDIAVQHDCAVTG